MAIAIACGIVLALSLMRAEQICFSTVRTLVPN